MIEGLPTISVPFVGYKTNAANQRQKERMRAWEDKLKEESSHVMGKKQPLTQEVRVVITACYVAKKTHDIDRIAKLVLDGIKGVAIRDDSQVKRLEVEIREGCGEDKTIVQIEAIER